ncbi:unnamed protein product [Prunus brigantina]
MEDAVLIHPSFYQNDGPYSNGAHFINLRNYHSLTSFCLIEFYSPSMTMLLPLPAVSTKSFIMSNNPTSLTSDAEIQFLLMLKVSLFSLRFRLPCLLLTLLMVVSIGLKDKILLHNEK